LVNEEKGGSKKWEEQKIDRLFVNGVVYRVFELPLMRNSQKRNTQGLLEKHSASPPGRG
jgi:hypothetical protein